MILVVSNYYLATTGSSKYHNEAGVDQMADLGIQPDTL